MSFRSAVKRNIATVTRQISTVGERDGISAPLRASVPVLRVPNVSRTLSWYHDELAFESEAFPAQAPHEFAILTRDGVQLMLRRRAAEEVPSPSGTGWDVYIRVGDGELRGLYAGLQSSSQIVRPLEQMPYGDLEFEVRDPDGYTLCLGESLSGTG